MRRTRWDKVSRRCYQALTSCRQAPLEVCKLCSQRELLKLDERSNGSHRTCNRPLSIAMAVSIREPSNRETPQLRGSIRPPLLSTLLKARPSKSVQRVCILNGRSQTADHKLWISSCRSEIVCILTNFHSDHKHRPPSINWHTLAVPLLFQKLHRPSLPDCFLACMEGETHRPA